MEGNAGKFSYTSRRDLFRWRMLRMLCWECYDGACKKKEVCKKMETEKTIQNILKSQCKMSTIINSTLDRIQTSRENGYFTSDVDNTQRADPTWHPLKVFVGVWWSGVGAVYFEFSTIKAFKDCFEGKETPFDHS